MGRRSTTIQSRAIIPVLLFMGVSIIGFYVTPFISSHLRPAKGLDLAELPDNPRYMAPYEPTDFVGDRVLTGNPLKVFGKIFTYEYTEDFEESNLDLLKIPPAIIEVEGSEQVNLPYGKWIKIDAILLIDTDGIVKMYDGDMNPISDEERVAFFKERFGRSPQWNLEHRISLPQTIQVYYSHNFDHSKLLNGAIYNAQNGGELNSTTQSVINPYHWGYQSSSGLENSDQGWETEVLLLEPTEVDFHLSFNNRPQKLLHISFKNDKLESMSYDEPEVEAVFKKDSIGKVRALHGELKEALTDELIENHIYLKVADTLYLRERPVAVTRGGKVINGSEVELNTAQESRVCQFDFDEDDELLYFHLWPKSDMTHIVFHLGELPLGDPSNKDRPFLEKKFPDLTNVSRKNPPLLLQTLFQRSEFSKDTFSTNRNDPLRSIRQVPWADVKFPKESPGTVEDFLNLYIDALPDFEYAFGPDYMFLISAQDRRYIYNRPSFYLHLVLDKGAIWIFLLISLKIVYLIRANALRKHLDALGFDLSIWEAEWLIFRFGRRAYRLPTRDEIASIPGINPGHLKDLAQVIRSRT